MAASSLQEDVGCSSVGAQAKALWDSIEQAYRKAEACGAISQINSQATNITDRGTGLTFVLQIAENLRDKPKQPSEKSKR